MYAVLFIKYLPLELYGWHLWVVKLLFISLVVITNIVGVEFLRRIFLFLFVIILSPFVLEAFFVLSEADTYFPHASRYLCM